MSSIESPFMLLKSLVASLLFLLLGAATADAEAAGDADEAQLQRTTLDLAKHDALYEACHGQRPQYRERFDTLMTATYPDLREVLLERYDFNYGITSQAYAATRGGPCSASWAAHIDEGAAKNFAALEPGGAADTAPASGAFDATIARAKSHSEECKKIREKSRLSISDFGGGRRAKANPNAASDTTSKRAEISRIANQCVLKCEGAWHSLDGWNGQSDSSLTQERLVEDCEASHKAAIASNEK